MLASELIRRSLRLINVPGRGGVLSGTDQADALDALNDLLKSKAVSRLFVPGIRRHFFPMVAGKAIYSYGPGAEFDTDLFGDPAPIKVEECYMRSGATLTDNQEVTNGDFVLGTGWTLGAGWTIANAKATLAPGNAGEILSQALSLVPGRSYTAIVQVAQRDSSLTLELLQDASPILTQVLGGSGIYEFEVGFAGTTSAIQFTADDADSDFDVLSVSVIETGLDRVSLPDGIGTDHTVEVIDQRQYARYHSKGTSGRAYQVLWSRGYPNVELRFDNAGESGDIAVLEVLCDRISVTSQASTLKLHPDALRWLKYALADELSGEYGKELRPSQRRILADAYGNMAGGGKRKRMLRVDAALLRPRRFNINRGDP